MKTVAIIQARMSSTRLPGKILEPINGVPMLAQIVRRVKSPKYEVMVATSDRPSDDAVPVVCQEQGIGCFRGSQDDVLSRFYGAAKEANAEIVIRLTGDNPIVDAGFVAMLLNAYSEGSYDYVSSTGFPIGLSAEVFGLGALEAANECATSPVHREHVTPYLYQSTERFHIHKVKAPEDWSGMRWTVDAAEDLVFAREVYARLGDVFRWQDVVALIKAEPQLQEINAHVQQKVLGQ